MFTTLATRKLSRHHSLPKYRLSLALLCIFRPLSAVRGPYPACPNFAVMHAYAFRTPHLQIPSILWNFQAASDSLLVFSHGRISKAHTHTHTRAHTRTHACIQLDVLFLLKRKLQTRNENEKVGYVVIPYWAEGAVTPGHNITHKCRICHGHTWPMGGGGSASGAAPAGQRQMHECDRALSNCFPRRRRQLQPARYRNEFGTNDPKPGIVKAS